MAAVHRLITVCRPPNDIAAGGAGIDTAADLAGAILEIGMRLE
jgi:hypothetical protein